jgi:hypothetical protein
MALPASGPISMSMIRTELQNGGKTTDLSLTFLGSMSGSGANRTSGYTPINQSSLTKPSSLLPASVGEWYSYDHSTNKACSNGLNLVLGSYYSYIRYEVTGPVGSTSTTQMYLPTNPGGNTIKCHIYTGSYPFTNLGTLTGTPVFNGTFTTTGTQSYSFNLASTSTILHVVAWDETVAVGNYLFAVSPSCGTTTTTTTQPPLTITNGVVTCSGTTGTFTSTLSGGNGTYIYVAIDTSAPNVSSLINTGISPSGLGSRVTPNNSAGPGTHVWSGIANGNWNTAVSTSIATATQNTVVNINCTTTSTTTTTTTAATRTVRIYGNRQGTLGTSRVYYKVNSGGTVLGGGLLTTTGTLYYTLTVNSGDTVYIYTSPDADTPVSYHHDCAQVATDTYCTTFTCSGSLGKTFTITTNTDISVRSNPTLGTC